MEKLLNLHNNNHKIQKIFLTNRRFVLALEVPTFSKPLMRVQKKSVQQQGEKRAKYHLEEVKKKFINLLMRDGEKSKAHKLFTESLNLLEKKTLTSTPPSISTFGGDGKQTVYKNHSAEKTENLPRTKSADSKEHSIYISNIPSAKQIANIPSAKQIPNILEGCKGCRVTNRKIVSQGCKCNNKAELFRFYTLYNTVEKNGTFEKNERLVDISAEENNESTHKNKGYHPERMVEENYCNDFLKKNILYQAIENVKPPLELRRVRKGGTTYQVPAIVSQKRQERLAIKWIIESAYKRKNKKGNSFSESLVTEILEAFNKTGQVRQKRDEILKIAEYNRAYTRYRWW